MNIGINRKVRRGICVFAIALAVTVSAIAAFIAFSPAAYAAETASETGAYTITATPFYAHPVTGVMEDSGQNPGIGQGMTESVLAQSALLEVYDNGARYVTVRFSLMDNIKDISMSVQKDADSEFEDATFTITKEDMDAGTADLRFAVPDENAIARATMFVEPMGRDVIFFMNFADPVPGAGDFVTNAEPEDSSTVAPAKEGTDTEVDTPTESGTPQAADTGKYETVIFILAAVLIVIVIAVIGTVFYRRKAKR
jgi:hypothetical protein